MSTWSLQEAKARFSELVNTCLNQGPQLVTRHGQPAVVLVPASEYESLVRPKTNLKDFFLEAPRVHLTIDRSAESGRGVEL